MTYFDFYRPSDSDVSKTLDSIDNSLNQFYETQSRDVDQVIRLHSSTLDKSDLLQFVKAYLEGNITVGKYNHEYEARAAAAFGTKYCVSSNSGSSANLVVISALVQSGRLKAGDLVAVPALSWSTTVFPLVQYGLVPVYIDISNQDFNLSIAELKKCIHELPVKALMLIHTYGNPANMDEILSVCDESNILLIEDTCESMGAMWTGQPVGSFGVAGTFSSYYSHHICTLEGGLTVTNDKHLDDYMRSIRSHGWTRGTSLKPPETPHTDIIDPTFLFLNTGYNLRLSDPQAAMGITQLDKLDDYVKSRQAVAKSYKRSIAASSTLSYHLKYPTVHEKASSSWFGFPVFFPYLEHAAVSELRTNLRTNGVETRPFLAGDFSLQPVNSRFKSICYGDLELVRQFQIKSFALPCHQSVTPQQVLFIMDQLEKLITPLSNQS